MESIDDRGVGGGEQREGAPSRARGRGLRLRRPPATAAHTGQGTASTPRALEERGPRRERRRRAMGEDERIERARRRRTRRGRPSQRRDDRSAGPDRPAGRSPPPAPPGRGGVPRRLPPGRPPIAPADAGTARGGGRAHADVEQVATERRIESSVGEPEASGGPQHESGIAVGSAASHEQQPPGGRRPPRGLQEVVLDPPRPAGTRQGRTAGHSRRA